MSKHSKNNSQIIGQLHLLKEEEVTKIQQLLLDWYYSNCRVLPWRNIAKTETDYNKRAYAVWVSEIMCQQTQVATVVDYYNRWMLQWPTVVKLADATLEEVNKTWAGLGYYSRAKRLHEGALKVTNNLNGKFPKGRDSIQKELPGVGRYTASAIASISSKEPVGVVDGNVFRVLSRLRAIGADISSQPVIEEIWKISDQLVDKDEPGDFNQALMELGALVCTPKTPKCSSCPVKNLCVSYNLTEERTIGKYRENRLNKENCLADIECVPDCSFCLKRCDWDESLGVQNFPRKSKKTLVRNKISAVVIVRKEGKDNVPDYLFIQRPKKGLLANLWEFVSVAVSHDNDNENEHKNTEGKPLINIDEKYIKEKLETSLKEDFKFPNKLIKNLNFVSEVTHIFSHIHQIYRVYETTCQNNDIKISHPQDYQGIKWMSEEGFLVCATSTAMKKVFKAYKTSISKDNKASLSGLAIGGFFVYLFLELSAMSRASQSTLYITYFFMGLGAVMILTGLFGCCGALHESRCVLALFFLFIGILLGSQLAVCVLTYQNFKSIEREFGEGLKANIGLYHKNKGIKVSLDFAQRQLKCCGSHGPADWGQEKHLEQVFSDGKAFPDHSNSFEKLIQFPGPESCCISGKICQHTFYANTAELGSSIYQEGCTKKIFDWIRENKHYIFFALFGVALLEIFALILSLVLCITFNKIQEYFDD